ncbi:MAG: type VI secretion system tip protein VgrG [Rhodocyclales bacterium GT-UBC]|nr:MAG: type VI secretion system tip protein VgrG [Rhodocyclales bacterium GT-UBC]
MSYADLAGLSQENRILRLRFPNDDGPGSSLYANILDAYEGLSRDFRYVVEVISEDAGLALKDLMGKRVTIELVRSDGSLRYFNGHVFEFRHTGSDGGFAFYDMVLLPWLTYLQLRTDNYLFHDKSTRQALEDIFGDYPERHVEFRVAAGKTHTFQAQWDETDYNYVHRRLEEAGWYYWYEHDASQHRLIISDDSLGAPVIDGDDREVAFVVDATSEDHDSLSGWAPVRQLASGKVAVSGFDFKNPRPQHAAIETLNQQGEVRGLEVYEYAGAFGFTNAAQGDALARLRMEEIESRAKHFEASGNCRWLQPGRWFDMAGHYELDRADPNQRRFLVVEVRHSASNNYLQANGLPQYRNTASCQRKYIPYRPGRGYNSVQPRIYGIQSALVVGPAGEEIFCDSYGRVRIQFHWDREGSYDDKSSCWVRVASSWAGSNFGAVSLPRIGQEVLVQWLDGNPDLPIITGRVYNASNQPPWPLPANKTQSGILSRSSKGGGYENANAIRFEDKKGEEEVWLHAEKDQRIEVEHDESHWVGNDRTKTIDHDETVHVKHDRTETVDNNETITVHNNRTERVDHNETISIGDNRTEDVGLNETISIGENRSETVGANESIHIGDNRSVSIGGNKSESVARAKTESIGMAKALSIGLGYQVTVGGAMNTTVGLMQAEEVGLSKTVLVGKTFSITAGDELSITVGKSSLVMKADGRIEIRGQEILIAGEKKVEIHGDDVDINPN